MITAIDTNVLLDVFLPDPEYGAKSLETLKNCSQEGALIISEVVYTELACAFKEEKRLDEVLQKSGIRLEVSNKGTLWKAGEFWKLYRSHSVEKSSKLRRILPDFWIGAHALLQADRLLTRDRGFYRDYFKILKIIAPV